MDVLRAVNPAYRVLVDGALAATTDLSDLAAIRARMRANLQPAPLDAGLTRTDVRVPADGTSPEIPLLLLRPAAAQGVLPLVYWIHGGGYYAGFHEQDLDKMTEWALAVGCAVASVDYRLAPENPYPAPLDDCYEGLLWLIANAEQFDIDTGRVVIAGASAGGGLAAGLTLRAREHGSPELAGQLLVAPLLDDLRQSPSTDWDTAIWNRERNYAAWRHYLAGLFDSERVPAEAAAFRATDLSDLPPTMLIVGSIDLLVDENVEFARRLVHASVPTELHVYAGAPHGFDAPALGGDSPLGRRARDEMIRWLREIATDAQTAG